MNDFRSLTSLRTSKRVWLVLTTSVPALQAQRSGVSTLSSPTIRWKSRERFQIPSARTPEPEENANEAPKRFDDGVDRKRKNGHDRESDVARESVGCNGREQGSIEG
ncbi:hypothetical protein C8R45DRAFT_1035140 [Mycena sanguinolenta]|nr:hypothetical protein C8R45DRAFT_1035140 [Mycena sanguinolenta]